MCVCSRFKRVNVFQKWREKRHNFTFVLCLDYYSVRVWDSVDVTDAVVEMHPGGGENRVVSTMWQLVSWVTFRYASLERRINQEKPFETDLVKRHHTVCLIFSDVSLPNATLVLLIYNECYLSLLVHCPAIFVIKTQKTPQTLRDIEYIYVYIYIKR